MAANETLWENCRDGNLGVVKNFLENDGADPNSIRQEGTIHTCLMIAAGRNRAEVVSLLLDQPTIEVNKRGGYHNNTALHHACFNNCEAALKRLLSATGVDVNPLDVDNKTPIMVAVMYSSTECVRLMSAVAEVDLDCKFLDGQTLERASPEILTILEKARERREEERRRMVAEQKGKVSKVLLEGLYDQDCSLNLLKRDKDGIARNYTNVLERIWEFTTKWPNWEVYAEEPADGEGS